METINDGGPAFPISLPGFGDNGAHGMSLRDYMAVHAGEQDVMLQAELMRSERLKNGGPGILPDGWHVIARYRHADMMLKAREQKGAE